MGQPPRLGSHRGHCHHRRAGGQPLHARGGRRRSRCQRVDALHRRRAVRVRCRDRHQHTEAPRTRPDGSAGAHHDQVRGHRRRADPSMTASPSAEGQVRSPMAEDTRFESVAQVRQELEDVKYLADEGIAGVVFLAERLGKPVLVEGPAGTGKTQLAKSVAEMTGSRLIRLQCYEGLDESKALFEWNYKKQLLRIQAQRVTEAEGGKWTEIEEDIFSEDFLLTRPLLEAI